MSVDDAGDRPERIHCANLPTRLEFLKRYGAMANCRVWIKRDDETGFLQSGNKVRKLEYTFARALSEGCSAVVTCGGVNSNHCRATAVLAARLGLKCDLFLRTADGEAPADLQGNTLLVHLAGATVRWITPEAYAGRDDLMNAHVSRHAGMYAIPEGASDGIGAWGYVRAIDEIRQQLHAAGESIDCIVHAMGSGGTTAGLTAGVAIRGLPWRVVGVPVCDDAAYFRQRVHEIRLEMEAYGAPPDAGESALEIIDGYQGRGYALTTPDELAFIRDMLRCEGVLLDPCYTGKAFFALDREIRKGRWPADTRILFLHTGGGFANFSYAHEWQEVL